MAFGAVPSQFLALHLAEWLIFLVRCDLLHVVPDLAHLLVNICMVNTYKLQCS